METYGELLSGSYQPGSDFASLEVTGAGTVYSFTLTAFDLNSLFTTDAFIGTLAAETKPDIKLSGPGATTVIISDLSGGGVSQVYAINGGGPGGGWDFHFDFGAGGNDRLLAFETISWTATFSNPVTFEDFAMHVQGLTAAQGESAWYTNVTNPVPEAETFSMLLIGLSMLGVIVHRRQQH